MKQCSKCHEFKNEEDFYWQKKRNQRQARCKMCDALKQKDYHYRNPCRSKIQSEKQRNKINILFCEYLKDKSCIDCGEDDPIVLQFDHLHNKISEVSTMVNNRKPWNEILIEINKCEIVCANCHKRRTSRRANDYRFRFFNCGMV